MSRIEAKFEQLKSSGRNGFIPFITAGDPDLDTTRRLVLALANLGADVIELGVPFSDPMADGPTIQASSMRALANGTKLNNILAMVAGLRSETEVPIVLFSYLNPLYRYGLDRLADDAAAAGVDGLLVTDAIDEDAESISELLRPAGMDLISLAAPTTSDRRLAFIAAGASGFIYAVSRTGVTGARQESSDAAEALVERIRQRTELPVAVGFGISTRKQVEDVWNYADAAVVGSAIVKVIEGSDGPSHAVDRVRGFVRSIVPTFAKESSGT